MKSEFFSSSQHIYQVINYSFQQKEREGYKIFKNQPWLKTSDEYREGRAGAHMALFHLGLGACISVCL